ncbi:YHYH domain-containing protein [Sphingomonas sp. ABOLG]|nr:excalibur calcium-binding domain-containing protein [Sphingomonas sp. ABOLG]RSV20369.1 YHYH domain-containing protein [Sphingomonas sp. ABOLG]
MRLEVVLVLAAVTAAWSPNVEATPGGLNARGCHNDRKGGTGYHCHGGSAEPTRRVQALRSSTGGAFANCSAARAAGAAPVRRGDPGYGPHLDRDDDGIGCER